MASQIPMTGSSTTTVVFQKVPILSISPATLDIETTPEISKRWRPCLHLVAPRGWLNDPCAPGYDPINKVYHLGFQWNPNSTEWGNISWGAAVSHDLLSWKISVHPTMQPSPRYDPCGVFTGCLVPTAVDGAENGVLTAIYTSVSHLPIHHTRPYFRTSEAVALATSQDSGRTWTRRLNDPILAEPPQDVEVTGWRDPFVAPWPSMDRLVTQQRSEDDKFLYAVVAGGIRGKTPTMFLYQVNARALDKWQYLGPLITPGLNFCPSARWTGDFGVNWEVSNFVSLKSPDGKISRDFLICGVEGRLSTADDMRTKGACRAANAQMWMCGSLESAPSVHMEYRFGGILDHGTYYAGNSFWDPQTEQQIIYGWILEDDLDSELRKQQGWAGAISLPRVLKMHVLPSVVGTLSSPLQSVGSIELIPEDEKASSFTVVSLCAVPDPRLQKLRGSKFPEKEDLVRYPSSALYAFPEDWSQWEMKLSFNAAGNATKLGFEIIHSPTESTKIYFDPTQESILIDRSRSSHHPSIRRCPEEAPHTLFTFNDLDTHGQPTGTQTLEALDFHVLYDCSVLSVFVNERTALTTRVYPASGSSTGVLPFVERGDDDLGFSGVDAKAWSLELWPLRVPV